MLKSKKGVTITIVVLIAITIASFSVWQIPDNPKMTIVVTDFESHLDGIDARHEIIIDAVDTSLSEMTNGDITPEELISIAEISSSQINSQIIELIESDAPEEWQESYINRIASLKSFEAYIIETMVMANLINNDGEVEQRTEILNNIEKLKEESIQYGNMANSSKP